MEKTCRNCGHADFQSDQADFGQCRISPPAPTWPRVEGEAWCSKWTGKAIAGTEHACQHCRWARIGSEQHEGVCMARPPYPEGFPGVSSWDECKEYEPALRRLALKAKG